MKKNPRKYPKNAKKPPKNIVKAKQKINYYPDLDQTLIKEKPNKVQLVVYLSKRGT